VRRWLGGEARRAQWGSASKITVLLLYLLALSGAVIVYLVLLAGCKSSEPAENRSPNTWPSQRYVSDVPEPCRCGDRPELADWPSEDPRLLP